MLEEESGVKAPFELWQAKAHLGSCADRLAVAAPLELDLDVHARRQLPHQHQRVHRLRRRLQDIDQTLVRPDLELLPRVRTCPP